MPDPLGIRLHPEPNELTPDVRCSDGADRDTDLRSEPNELTLDVRRSR